MGQFLPVLALLVLAGIFASISLLASGLLNTRRPNKAKNAPYECGVTEETPPPERFPVRFYLIAMIFVVFDIEIIFLYPYATVFRDLGVFGLLAIAIFAGAVFETFLYVIANGALEWGPARQIRRSRMSDPTRTLRSTVRRVGLEGRPEASPVQPAAAVADTGTEAA